MSVLLDTSFIVAFHNPDDDDHDRAVQIFQEILHGVHGKAHSTNLIFAEAVTLSFARTRRHAAAVRVGEFFYTMHDGRPLVLMHHLAPAQLASAWADFRRHRDKTLSVTDWTLVSVARELEAEHIVSFDDGFDGIYPRLS